MRRTLPQQIAANRRASLFFVGGLIALLVALCTTIVGYYNSQYWWVGTLGAAALGIVAGMVAYYSGADIMLSISHARPADQREDQILNNVVEEMAIAGGIPKPKIYVIDDPSPNAFATGRDPEHAVVCFTTGLISKLDRDELQGVAAHELSHIRNYDTRFMTTVTIIAGLIPLIADGFRRSLWWGGGRRSRSRDDNNLGAIFAVIAIVLSILAPIFALLLQLAVSRQREFLADASGAELTRYPEALARALQKISTDPAPLQVANRATQHMFIVNPLRGEGGSDIFSTHPSTQARIQALLNLAGNYPQRSLQNPMGTESFAGMPDVSDQTLPQAPPRLGS